MAGKYLMSVLCICLFCQGCSSQKKENTLSRVDPPRTSYEKCSSPWSKHKGEKTVGDANASNQQFPKPKSSTDKFKF